MSKRIIVLEDGETWDIVVGAKVWDITDEAYEKLLNGDEPKHLTAGDVLDTVEIQ